MFTLYLITFPPAPKPYWIGLLVAHRFCHEAGLKQATDGDRLILTGPQATSTLHRIGLLFTHKNGGFGAISVTERSCARADLKRGESHIG